MTVQIVRLKDGSDVISQVYVFGTDSVFSGSVELQYPMMFSVINQNLVLEHWLPLAVMKEKSVMIPREEVLCFMEPNDNFEDYYKSAVRKVTSVINKKETEVEEMMEALDELENTKGIKIH